MLSTASENHIELIGEPMTQEIETPVAPETVETPDAPETVDVPEVAPETIETPEAPIETLETPVDAPETVDVPETVETPAEVPEAEALEPEVVVAPEPVVTESPEYLTLLQEKQTLEAEVAAFSEKMDKVRDLLFKLVPQNTLDKQTLNAASAIVDGFNPETALAAQDVLTVAKVLAFSRTIASAAESANAGAVETDADKPKTAKKTWEPKFGSLSVPEAYRKQI